MRPLDLLNLNVNRPVTIIVKRNQRYLGLLAGFDEHLNLFIEKAKSEKKVQESGEEHQSVETDDEDEVHVTEPELEPALKNEEDEMEKLSPPTIKVEEEVGNIVLRGDNIIFLKFDKPNFGKPPHPGQDRNREYQRGEYQGTRGSNREYVPRRDNRDDRGPRDRNQGYNRGERDRGYHGGNFNRNDRDRPRPRGPPQRGPGGQQRNNGQTPRDKE
nr:LSM domain-containing protein [Candidatus Sigynarchaeota archaeon]